MSDIVMSIPCLEIKLIILNVINSTKLDILSKKLYFLALQMGSDQTNTNEDEKFNPWDVHELEEFLFFCCPECDDRSPTKASFINHALIQHPRVRYDSLPFSFYI